MVRFFNRYTGDLEEEDASAPSSAAVDPKIAEFCMKATDFAGCVQTMTGGIPPKQTKHVEDGLRTWTRDDGSIVRMRTNAVMAIQNRGKYGRYIEYRYGLERKKLNRLGSLRLIARTTQRIGTKIEWDGAR